MKENKQGVVRVVNIRRRVHQTTQKAKIAGPGPMLIQQPVYFICEKKRTGSFSFLLFIYLLFLRATFMTKSQEITENTVPFFLSPLTISSARWWVSLLALHRFSF
jgi:hypothetical protein